MRKVLGVDVGGVIIDGRGNDNEDTSFFGSNYLKTAMVPGAFEAIARIRPAFDDVYVVSKCSPEIQGKTRQWMSHHGFHEATGITPDKVRFCLDRADKAPICAELGVNFFIDDRLEVMGYLKTVPYRFLFQPSEREIERFQAHLSEVRRVESWPETVTQVCVTLPERCMEAGAV